MPAASMTVAVDLPVVHQQEGWVSCHLSDNVGSAEKKCRTQSLFVKSLQPPVHLVRRLNAIITAISKGRSAAILVTMSVATPRACMTVLGATWAVSSAAAWLTDRVRAPSLAALAAFVAARSRRPSLVGRVRLVGTVSSPAAPVALASVSEEDMALVSIIHVRSVRFPEVLFG